MATARTAIRRQAFAAVGLCLALTATRNASPVGGRLAAAQGDAAGTMAPLPTAAAEVAEVAVATPAADPVTAFADDSGVDLAVADGGHAEPGN